MDKKLERSEGKSEICFKKNNIQKLYQRGSSKILIPNTYSNNKEIVLVNTSGGLTCNDKFNINIYIEDSNVSVCNQAAEKIYAGIGDPAYFNIDISIKNSNVIWLPKELILFNNSKLKRKININLDENSNIFFHETSIFGRKAMSEDIKNLFYSDIWKIKINSKLKHFESIYMNGNINKNISNKFTFGNNSSMSTIIILGKIVDEMKTDLEKIIKEIKDIYCEISIWNKKIVIRSLSNDNYDLKKILNNIFESVIKNDIPKNWYL